VTDFTTILTTEAAGFTDGERREVVVQDEALRFWATGVGVHFLGFVSGASVAMASAWVSPREKMAEPCVRGSTEASP
jgi:hypothetical protein